MISLHNSSDIFEVMARANRLQRNTFQKGDASADYKYIDYLPMPGNDNLEKEEGIAAEYNVVPDSEMHAPDGTSRSDQDYQDSDNVDEGSYDVGNVGVGDSSHGKEITKPAIYTLRNRSIYCMSISRHKPKYYSNLSIGNLQVIMDRAGYNATKNALRGHNAICDLVTCHICDFNKEAKNYSFSPTNIKNTSLVSENITTKTLNKRTKTVHFEKSTNFNHQVNNVSINFTRIQQSVAAACSLLETNLLYK